MLYDVIMLRAHLIQLLVEIVHLVGDMLLWLVEAKQVVGRDDTVVVEGLNPFK